LRKSVSVELPERKQKPLTKDVIFEEIQKAGKEGLSSSEIYKLHMNLAPRTIRQSIQTLEFEGIVKHNQCRCGHTPYYYAIKR